MRARDASGPLKGCYRFAIPVPGSRILASRDSQDLCRATYKVMKLLLSRPSRGITAINHIKAGTHSRQLASQTITALALIVRGA
jgi:hypothetical protein